MFKAPSVENHALELTVIDTTPAKKSFIPQALFLRLLSATDEQAQQANIADFKQLIAIQNNLKIQIYLEFLERIFTFGKKSLYHLVMDVIIEDLFLNRNLQQAAHPSSDMRSLTLMQLKESLMPIYQLCEMHRTVSPLAKFFMGMFNELNLCNHASQKIALRHYQDAAVLGCVHAQFELYLWHLENKESFGIIISAEMVFEYLHSAGQAGYQPAQRTLQKIHQQHDQLAQQMVSSLVAKDENDPANQNIAERLSEMLRQREHRAVMFHVLDKLHKNKIALPFEFLKKMVAMVLDGLRHQLHTVVYPFPDVPAVVTATFDLYECTADAGDKHAQFGLAELYKTGVPGFMLPQPQKAMRYMTLAAAQHCQPARDALQNMQPPKNDKPKESSELSQLFAVKRSYGATRDGSATTQVIAPGSSCSLQ